MGADGIGLLRTEYLFRGRTTPPSYEEQEQVYLAIAEQLGDRMLTVRALYAGGDKPVDYMSTGPEQNPFLGQRGIRLLLTHPDILRDQFRALLRLSERISHSANLRFMLPMISTRRELDAARAILDEVLATTGEKGSTTGGAIQIGVLIEVPAAALMADRLAGQVDFFSIGTNDLAQYVLASDRTNSNVADLADPLHPAVLRMIDTVCAAARTAGITVSICGEITGDPIATPLLLGLGIDELSVPLPAVPLIKQVIRQCELTQCRQLAQSALACDHVSDVRAQLNDYLDKINAN
jgi:phosphocarrier protein FPr